MAIKKIALTHLFVLTARFNRRLQLFNLLFFLCSYINGVAEAAKKSPELIQLLELHTQFASITPYAQVRLAYMTPEPFSSGCGAIRF